jgi:rhamnosyltransferase
MREIPFVERQFCEDFEWGKRAILAGRTIVMDPNSVVIHSHNNSLWYEFKRVYLDHQNLHDLFGLHTVPSLKLCFKLSLGETKRLAGIVWADPRGLGYRLKWLVKVPIYAFTQTLAQYLGARSNCVEKNGIWSWLDNLFRKGI